MDDVNGVCPVCDGTGMLLDDLCPLCGDQGLQELTLVGLGGDVWLHLHEPGAELTILELKDQMKARALREDRIVCFQVLHENNVLGDAVNLGELSLPPVATLQVMIFLPPVADVEAMLIDACAQTRLAAAKTLMNVGDSGRRCKAIAEFKRLGATAVVHVAGALGDECAAVRSTAFKVFVDNPVTAAPHASAIVGLLRDPDHTLRKLASKHLKAIMLSSVTDWHEPSPEKCDPHVDVCTKALKVAEQVNLTSSPYISKLLADPDDGVRKSATEAIGKFGVLAGQHMEQIIALLSDGSANVRKHAVEALGAVGPLAATHAPKVAQLLHDTDPGVRSVAPEVLGRMGVLASPYAGQLAPLLCDTDARVRRHTAHALGRIGVLAAQFAPQLARCLRDTDDGVRGRAVQAIGKFGKLASAHASEVCELLNDRDSSVRRHAAETLGKTTLQYEVHAACLAAALSNDVDVMVRIQAATALGHLGSPALAQASVLVMALDEPDCTLRIAAAAALGELGPCWEHVSDQILDRLQEHLLAMLRDPNPSMKQQAAETLSKLHMPAWVRARNPVVDSLIALLPCDDRAIRFHAVEALSRTGRRAWTNGEALCSCLGDTDHSVREKAVGAIGKISNRPAEHADALAALLSDLDHNVRSEAAEALGKIFGSTGLHHMPAARAAPYALRLAACLRDPSYEVRLHSAEALGKLGSRAAAHVEELEFVRDNDQDFIVRERATDALQKLRGPSK